MHVCMYVTAVCQSNANILFKTTVLACLLWNLLTSLIQNILDEGYFPKVFFNFQNINRKDYVQRLQIWLNPVTQAGVYFEKISDVFISYWKLCSKPLKGWVQCLICVISIMLVFANRFCLFYKLNHFFPSTTFSLYSC